MLRYVYFDRLRSPPRTTGDTAWPGPYLDHRVSFSDHPLVRRHRADGYERYKRSAFLHAATEQNHFRSRLRSADFLKKRHNQYVATHKCRLRRRRCPKVHHTTPRLAVNTASN